MAIDPVLTLASMDDDALPFGPGDTTAGSETELQAVVVGGAEQVDLPLTIFQSKYFANLVKRLQSQDMPRKAHRDLRKFLADNTDRVWELGNVDALKRDLAAQGEYDPRMAFYMLYRQRPFGDLGFSGFEGRHYSLCDSLEDDLAYAVDLQNLVTALAFRYVARGEVTHPDIPDRPTIESERRQIFFGAAVGIPTFYVRKDSANRFLRRVLAGTECSRSSRRYAGYVRVDQRDYQLALLKLIRHDAAGLVKMLGAEPTLADLERRLQAPAAHSVAGKLTRGILDLLNVRSPLAARPAEFNAAAERYYRDGLRRRHTCEAFRVLAEQCAGLPGSEDWRQAEAAVLADRADRRQLEQLIRVVLEVVQRQEENCERNICRPEQAPRSSGRSPLARNKLRQVPAEIAR